MKEKKDDILSTPHEKSENPYKGLRPYEETDKDKFYGRSEETEELYHLVLFNMLSVVYGKSGVGKTSLLNASVFPLLRKARFLPIRVRLNYAKESMPLPEQIRQVILAELKEYKIEVSIQEENKPLKTLARDETFWDNFATLWEYFHRARHFKSSGNKKIDQTLVLIFDQFEELFTLGKDHKDKNALIDELYWLIENQLPASYKEKILTDDGVENVASSSTTKPDVRVIISLREDYLPNFMELKSPIVSIDHNMFRVTHLNGTQAKEIIRIGFKEEKHINDILRLFYPAGVKANETVPDEKLVIEPTFLSLMCQQLYEKQERGLKLITREEQDKILGNYYDSVMKDSPKKAEKYIENNLLNKEGFRTPFRLVPGRPLEEYIRQLIDRRILKQSSWGEGEYIEIIHDLLVPIIIEKRNRRIKKKKNVTIAFLSFSVLFLLVLSLFAIYQWIRAEKQYKDVQELKVTSKALLEFPKDNTMGMRIAEAAYKMGLPDPQEYTSQNLAAAGYSSFEVPFYITSIHHSGPIYRAVFSPDGTRILTASEDGTAKVQNLENNSETTLKGHKARIKYAVFSPDGSRIITASWDKTAKLWDLQGRLLTDLKEHTAPVTFAAFSSDGQLLLTASRDGTAKLWSLEGKLLADLKGHTAAVASTEFSPDGKRILTASWDRLAKLWDNKGKILRDLKHDGAVSSGVFSLDGSSILTASSDKRARLWDRNGNLLKELKHNAVVTSAVFSKDGSRILTASQDGTVKVWNMEGRQLVELKKHTGEISSAVFSPDGSLIITASQDHTVKLWNLEGNLLIDLNKFKGIVYSAFFSPDSSRFLTACEDGTATVWTLDSNILVDLNKHTAEVNRAEFSPDGSLIVTTSRDHTVKLWSLNGKLLFDLNKYRDVVTTAVFSPDGQKIVTASYDNTAKIWNLDGRLIADLNKHKDVVTSAVFSPDGRLILTASWDRTAKLWNEEGTIISNFRHHRELVTSAVFSPDGRMILTASVDGTAKVCDLDGKILATFMHKDVVTSAKFSPDGRYILTASDDGTAKVWNLKKELLAELDKHEGKIMSALFSPDGSRILTASEDGTARVWDLEGKLLKDLKYNGPVFSAEFSPDGRYIVTASEDGTAKLWDLEGNLLADLNKHKDVVNYAAFSPDGRRIITASRDGTAKVWYTPEAIYEWLKTSKISQLSEKDKEELKIK